MQHNHREQHHCPGAAGHPAQAGPEDRRNARGEGVAPVTTSAALALVKALARAFRYMRMLDEGRYASVTEMAAAEKIDRG